MFFNRARSRACALLPFPLGLALLLGACAKSPPAAPPRLAVLRCENLTGDPSRDWQGRALSEILSVELSAGTPVVQPALLRANVNAMGSRPPLAPGISAEREAALASGANRLLVCEFSVSGGNLRVSAAEQNASTQHIVRRAAATGDLFTSAANLARQFTDRPRPFGTASQAALRAYAEALDAADPDHMRDDFSRAVAADPNFAPAYLAWADLEAARHDRDAMARVLALAQARGDALPPYDRARLALLDAELRADTPARARALAALAKEGPPDAPVYRSLAEIALAGRRFREAVNYYRQALQLAPGDVAMLNQLGYAQAYLGDYDAAIRTLRDYQRLRPNDANPIDSQGDVNLYFNRYADAEKLYLAAEQKAPNFAGGAELLKAARARLCTGDVTGADQIFQRYAAALEARRDPAAVLQKAAWLYLSGRRREALAALQPAAGQAPPPVAVVFRAQLAIWYLELGDRERAAAQLAALRGQEKMPPLAALAVFLNQAPAPVAEWQARAARLFGPAQQDLPAAYALLFQRRFADAVPLLRHAWEESNPNTGEGLPVLLAWAMIEAGKWDGITALVGPTPIPLPTGIGVLDSLWFPRLFYLRGRLADRQSRHDQALGNYSLFQKLSGPTPDLWNNDRYTHQSR